MELRERGSKGEKRRLQEERADPVPLAQNMGCVVPFNAYIKDLPRKA